MKHNVSYRIIFMMIKAQQRALSILHHRAALIYAAPEP